MSLASVKSQSFKQPPDEPATTSSSGQSIETHSIGVTCPVKLYSLIYYIEIKLTKIQVGFPIAQRFTKRSCPPVTRTLPDFGPIFKQFVFPSWHAKLAIFCDLTRIYTLFDDKVNECSLKRLLTYRHLMILFELLIKAENN
jgi:hypothetical protein